MYTTKTINITVATVVAFVALQASMFALAENTEIDSLLPVDPYNGDVRDLKFLGTVGAKLFFYDNTIHRNWTNAASYCKEANMELGSIETSEERDLIVTELQALGRGQRRTWTAGRAIMKADGFVWDNTGDRLDMEAIGNWNEVGNYRFCVLLISDSSSFEFFRGLCAAANKGVLCQVKHNSPPECPTA